MTTNAATDELIDLPDLSPEQWLDHVEENGWGDGFPVVVPTEEAVAPFLEAVRGANEPLPPIPPRRVVPSMRSLAANAVMAGCRPEYFGVIVAAVRATAEPSYNLHGMLATTHPCANMLLVSGPGQERLGINAGANCFGQGHRANATIGRALQLIFTNLGGAKPGSLDRSTQGSPAKYSFCFGENETASPWPSYRVRNGFSEAATVVTLMAAEPPSNINDHASTSGEGILITVSQTMSQSGKNNLYGQGPCFVVFGPEHAQTLHRDGWTVESIQEALHERSRVHLSRVPQENRDFIAKFDPLFRDDHYYLTQDPSGIHIVVAGGAGKHSAFIPSFGLANLVSREVPGE